MRMMRYDCEAEVAAAAARVVRSGGMIVYPTDTLYGLGVGALDPRGLWKIMRAKGRGPDVPMSIAVASIDDIGKFAEMDDGAREMVETYLPGPATVLLKARKWLKPPLVSKLGTVGLRVPDHPGCRRLLRACGPLTATSANVRGREPARTARDAWLQLRGKVDLYLDSGKLDRLPSTIIDLTGSGIKVIRQGALSV